MSTLMILAALLCGLFMARWMWKTYKNDCNPGRVLRLWFSCLLPAAVFLMAALIGDGASTVTTGLFVPAVLGAAAFAGGGLVLLALLFINTPINPEARERASEAIAKNRDNDEFWDNAPGGPITSGGPWAHGGPVVNGGSVVHGGPFGSGTMDD